MIAPAHSCDVLDLMFVFQSVDVLIILCFVIVFYSDEFSQQTGVCGVFVVAV